MPKIKSKTQNQDNRSLENRLPKKIMYYRAIGKRDLVR